MIYNFISIDFFKDVQQYVPENQFTGGQSDEVTRHLNEVSRIID